MIHVIIIIAMAGISLVIKTTFITLHINKFPVSFICAQQESG